MEPRLDQSPPGNRLAKTPLGAEIITPIAAPSGCISQSDRYQASDFQRLTLRRRLTVPASAFASPQGSLIDHPVCMNHSRSQRSGNLYFDHCVTEDDHGIAQSFLETIQLDDKRSRECPCCSVRQTRQLGRKSKSHTQLRTNVSDHFSPSRSTAKLHTVSTKGESPIERLPSEILDEIVAHLAIDLPPSGYAPRNVDLIACLLTSRTLHVATINTLYRHITIPHSQIFHKFLNHISDCPGFGSLIRRLDLSHFTSVGLGRSRQTNAEIQNLTARTLLRCLELTPHIKEVLLQENVDDDVDPRVLEKLLYGLPELRALDLCACSSAAFIDAFTQSLTPLKQDSSRTLSIRRLGLHECFTLPKSTFDLLLPRLVHLTHLDLSHTRVTDAALALLPTDARVSHLNLGLCTQITGPGTVRLLTSHPAVRQLVYLNLACDVARYRLLREPDVDALLPVLPHTLRSLNLNGAQLHSRHVQYLIPLTFHLEELGLAATNLGFGDINALFRRTTREAKEDIRVTDVISSGLDLDEATRVGNTAVELSQGPLLRHDTAARQPNSNEQKHDTAARPKLDIERGNNTVAQQIHDYGRNHDTVAQQINGSERGNNTAAQQNLGIMQDDNTAAFPAQPDHVQMTSPAAIDAIKAGPRALPMSENSSRLHYIDLSLIPSVTQAALFHTPAPANILLTEASAPLEVIELGEKVINSLRGCRQTNSSLGWCVKDLGRRGWYVREPHDGHGDLLGGRRSWKMGARWWGMRKIPIVWSEVGGLYGHYMFKR